MPYSRSYGWQTHPRGGGVEERAGLLQEALGRRTGGRHRKEQEGRKEGRKEERKEIGREMLGGCRNKRGLP